MSEISIGLLLVGFGYWLGAIPFGVFVGRRKGVDVRATGSGNSGAANVARTVGKVAGLFVLVLDAGKGAIPILAWRFVVEPQPCGWWLTVIGMAPIIGHCFSPWLRFGGGKGVATTFGVFLALDPLSAVVAFGSFAIVYLIFRLASIASIAAAASIPAYFVIRGVSSMVIALGAAAFILITIRHHANMRRLLTKSELHI